MVGWGLRREKGMLVVIDEVKILLNMVMVLFWIEDNGQEFKVWIYDINLDWGNSNGV